MWFAIFAAVAAWLLFIILFRDIPPCVLLPLSLAAIALYYACALALCAVLYYLCAVFGM